MEFGQAVAKQDHEVRLVAAMDPERRAVRERLVQPRPPALDRPRRGSMGGLPDASMARSRQRRRSEGDISWPAEAAEVLQRGSLRRRSVGQVEILQRARVDDVLPQEAAEAQQSPHEEHFCEPKGSADAPVWTGQPAEAEAEFSSKAMLAGSAGAEDSDSGSETSRTEQASDFAPLAKPSQEPVRLHHYL